MKFKFGCSKSDSFGLGFSYCNYDNTFSVEFIRWFFYVEVWSK